MDRTPPPRSALSPPATSETQTPDCRWPGKSRWSVQPIPPFSKMASAVPRPTGGKSGASSPKGSLPVSPATNSESLTAANGHSSDRNSVGKAVNPPASSELHSPAAVSTLDGDTSRMVKAAKGVIVSKDSASTHVPADPEMKGIQGLPIPAPLSQQARLGAWAQPLNFNSLSLNTQVGEETEVVISSQHIWPALSVHGGEKRGKKPATCKPLKNVTQAPQKQDSMEDDLRFPWAARMNPASRNLFRATEPEYLEDGTPKVIIPKHVLLQGLENQKEYILGQFYRCLPPPGGLIFAVFNKLWGRSCKITIRQLGESTYLFHIPDKETRNWVLQRGLWHVDDSLMFVASWIPEASLDIPEIKTIPVWVTLKKTIPSVLYSISGVSHIASGLGAPMATYKPRLDPIFSGEAKILVEVELNKAFPPRIAASDDSGFISMVYVEYAWLPSKCSRCGELGHKIRRCLKSTEDVNVATLAAPIIDPSTTQRTGSSAQGKSPEVNPSSKLVIPVLGSNVEDLTIPKSVDTPATSIHASDVEVPFSTSIVTVGNEPSSDVIIPLAPTSENTHDSIMDQTALIATANDSIETPFMASAKSASISDAYVQVSPPVHRESSRIIEPQFGSNKFGSLISLEEEEDSSDSDYGLDLINLMTPSDIRILRDRPVKPSTKAKEMYGHTTNRGRGGRGRGSRGGRG